MMTNRRQCAIWVSLGLFQTVALVIALPAGQGLVPPKPGSIAGGGGLQAEPPREWIDPDTGHRVVRLSDEPGSQSLYFHQNAYTGTKWIAPGRSGPTAPA